MLAEIKLKQEELYDRLKGEILAGKYPEGSRLPKEVDLAQDIGVARGTLRNALDMLEKDGLLARMRSKGTFVRPREKKASAKKILVLLDMQEKEDISWPSNHILPGIEKAAGENLFTEICPLQFVKDMDTDEGARFLRAANPHGFVIFNGKYNGAEKQLLTLQKLGRPVVMAACYPGDERITGFAGVMPNRKKAWEDGILFLKNKGHRRIATLSGTANVQGYGEDFEGHKNFLRAEGIFHPELFRTAGYNGEEIRAALEELMSLTEPPTAVMCHSDYYAMRLLNAALRQGVRVPENLAVMGFSGFSGAEYLDPPLATVDLQYFRMGETVAKMLENSEEWFGREGVSPPIVMTPHQIVERKSVRTSRVEERYR